TIRTANVPGAYDAGLQIRYENVSASRGKAIRAEPVAALFEQRKVHIVGNHPKLEDELTSWVPGISNWSPNRLDACLAAGTLMTTVRGAIPIEHVVIGDLVLTRAGWKPVTWSGLTNEAADTLTVEFSNGQSLTGTGNHPVWVEDVQDFVLLDA